MSTTRNRLETVSARHDRLERVAVELSKGCPAGGGNPVDCPLAGLRPLPAPARRKWLHELSSEELEYLAAYHRGCYFEKMAAMFR